MRNFFAILISMFLSSFLLTAGTFVYWRIFHGIILLIIWLFNTLCIPMIHFGILSRYLQKKQIGLITTILSTLLYVCTIIFNQIWPVWLLELSGKTTMFQIAYSIVWAMLCGAVILLNIHALSSSREASKMFWSLQASLAPAINAFGTFCGGFLVRKYYDDFEAILMITCAIFLAMVSYFFGRKYSGEKSRSLARMALWFGTVLISFCISCSLAFSPLVFMDAFGIILLLLSTVLVFVWYPIGMFVKGTLAFKYTPQRNAEKGI